jgi:predicted HTH transcriptional regulator
MDIGLSFKECDPWATYIDTSSRKRHGETGSAGLTESEAKVYELVKAKGKATKQEIMASLSLSAADLESELITLMHSELLKEMGEAGQRFLVPIPVPRS